MGIYQHIREAWKNPRENLGDIYKQRLLEWKKQPVTIRVHRPTRLDRARSLGYRAKPGIIIVRQRVLRGGRQRPKPGRRKPKRSTRRRDLQKSYQWVAEERVEKKFVNCTVLNSYWVGEDGISAWYEIILVDRAHPAIRADKNLSNIALQRGRAARGLTSAGRKSRGLRNKGKGAEKLRPSKAAHFRRKQKQPYRL